MADDSERDLEGKQPEGGDILSGEWLRRLAERREREGQDHPEVEAEDPVATSTEHARRRLADELQRVRQGMEEAVEAEQAREAEARAARLGQVEHDLRQRLEGLFAKLKTEVREQIGDLETRRSEDLEQARRQIKKRVRKAERRLAKRLSRFADSTLDRLRASEDESRRRLRSDTDEAVARLAYAARQQEAAEQAARQTEQLAQETEIRISRRVDQALATLRADGERQREEALELAGEAQRELTEAIEQSRTLAGDRIRADLERMLDDLLNDVRQIGDRLSE